MCVCVCVCVCIRSLPATLISKFSDLTSGRVHQYLPSALPRMKYVEGVTEHCVFSTGHNGMRGGEPIHENEELQEGSSNVGSASYSDIVPFFHSQLSSPLGSMLTAEYTGPVTPKMDSHPKRECKSGQV